MDLVNPRGGLLSENSIVEIEIYDPEDQPVLEFSEKMPDCLPVASFMLTLKQPLLL